jgi:hypothetical protein
MLSKPVDSSQKAEHVSTLFSTSTGREHYVVFEFCRVGGYTDTILNAALVHDAYRRKDHLNPNMFLLRQSVFSSSVQCEFILYLSASLLFFLQ